MKYQVGKFLATRHFNPQGWADYFPLTEWGNGDLIEEVHRLDGEMCRVIDTGSEVYCDLEFLDGTRLVAVSRGHVFF